MIAYFQTGYRFMCETLQGHVVRSTRVLTLLDRALGQHLDHGAALDLDFDAIGDFHAEVDVAQPVTLPSTPPAVATSSPLASASIMERCSFWRFIWGRIITKYSTTNISTSGSMLISEDCMSPPAAAGGLGKSGRNEHGGSRIDVVLNGYAREQAGTTMCRKAKARHCMRRCLA